MKLTDKEFRDLETIAKVDLEPQEREKLRLQLDRVIGFVRKLQEVETFETVAGGADVGPMAEPAADEPEDCLDREEVLGEAPDREEGFFRVPSVIDREDGGTE